MIEISKTSGLNFINSSSIRSRVGRIRVDHKGTVCCKCGSNYASDWLKRYDDNGNWNGKYICKACYCNPACRSGELNHNSSTYKGMIGVETVARVLGDKDCTVMKEGSPFDICSVQSIKYGKIEVKTVIYSPKYMYWVASNIKPGLFDTLFIICTDNKFEDISRVYIIDGIEVGNVSGITIVENPSRGGWYEESRIDDIIQYQEAFEIVKNESCVSRNYVNSGQNSMSTIEKGDICEEIVKITINAKTSTDIYYDLVHSGHGRVEVKGSDYHSRRKHWHVGSIESFKFDTLFIVCMGSNFEKVERVYIVPKEKVNVSGIAILEDPSRDGLYEKFRVDEEPYQAVYERILERENRSLSMVV